MKTSLIKFTLGSLAALAFSIAPAQAAAMINQLNNQAAESATNKINPNDGYGSWLVWPNAGMNVWNSWGLGVDGTATTAGGCTFTTDGTGNPFSLNLSANNAIAVDVTSLTGNSKTSFNVNFFSGADTSHGTTLTFNLTSPSASLATLSMNISTGVMAYGSTALADWTNITQYQIQGADWGTPTGFGMQFTNLQAQVVPEPATLALMGIAGGALLLVRRSRTRRES